MKHGISFVFIVFNDPLLLGIIEYLRDVFDVPADGLPPHLTIQGPFSDPVTSDHIKYIRNFLSGEEFFIGNAGTFATKKGAAFFLRVSSPKLIKIWNKPDFPIETYGFNPHITIYEGEDVARAEKAVKFLRREPLETICRSIDVVSHVSKQFELFERQSVHPDQYALQHFIRLGKIGVSFDARFRMALR